jgi:hypothetical protein
MSNNIDENALAETLVGRALEEVSRADSKASIVLAGALAAGGGLAATLAAEGVQLWHWPFPGILWAGALTAFGLGLFELGRVIYPRGYYPLPGQVRLYFGDFAAMPSAEDVESAVVNGSVDYLKMNCRQLWHVSMIAQEKYRLLRRGMLAIGVSLLGAFVALLAG